MAFIWRLKEMLTWLTVAAAIVFCPSSLFAVGLDPIHSNQVIASPSVVEAGKHHGIHILLRMEVGDVVEGLLQTARDDIRTRLKLARIGFTGLAVSGRTVQVQITHPADTDAAMAALETLTARSADSGVQELALDNDGSGLLKFELTGEGLDHRTVAAIARSIEVVRHRAQDMGAAELVVQPAGDAAISVSLSEVADRQALNEMLTRQGRLSFQLVDLSMSASAAIEGSPPMGSVVLYTQQDPPVPYLVEHRIVLSDKNLLDARPTLSAQTQPAVVFRLDSEGAASFKQMTRQNIGRVFVIVLDGHVISAPVIREPIDGGYGQISGNFTVQEANDIALLLRTGSLPARLTIAEEAR